MPNLGSYPTPACNQMHALSSDPPKLPGFFPCVFLHACGLQTAWWMLSEAVYIHDALCNYWANYNKPIMPGCRGYSREHRISAWMCATSILSAAKFVLPGDSLSNTVWLWYCELNKISFLIGLQSYSPVALHLYSGNNCFSRTSLLLHCLF